MIGLIAGVGAAVLFEVTEPAKAEPAKVAQYPKFAKSPLLLLFSLALAASRLFS
jgi:hypothetical protein